MTHGCEEMRTICIINQKGGVGKTTTAVSIAAGLSRQDRRVLLVDVDPQGSVRHSLLATKRYNLYHFLTGKCSHVDCISPLGKNLDLIHSNEMLTKVESHFLKSKNSVFQLKEKFADITDYDYIIFDCSPSLSLLNQNVMLFSQEAIIPVATNYLSLTGLVSMVEAIKEINEHFDHDLAITQIVPTLYDRRTKTAQKMLKQLQDDYGKKVSAPIRINSRLAEAPISGKSIFSYDQKSRGAKDYQELVNCILRTEQRIQSPTEPISTRVQRMMVDVEIED